MKVLAATVLPAVFAWDYTDQGATWYSSADPSTVGSDYEFCDTDSQSPINLISYQEYNGLDIMNFDIVYDEKYTISTYDWGSAARTYAHQTIKYQANPTGDAAGGADQVVEDSVFTSSYMQSMGAPETFQAAQFHIHSPSEHTVNGVQFDAEMHWVHLADTYVDSTITMPDDYAFATALGIMFKVVDGSNFDHLDQDLIDKTEAFLDWIKDDLGGATSAEADSEDKEGISESMNALLQAVDWGNRWSYSGSLTTPPCNTGVQHNVLGQVLPITQAQLDEIRTFTRGQDATFYTDTLGNYRDVLETQSAANAVWISDGTKPRGLVGDIIYYMMNIVLIAAAIGLALFIFF